MHRTALKTDFIITQGFASKPCCKQPGSSTESHDRDWKLDCSWVRHPPLSCFCVESYSIWPVGSARRAM